MKMKEESSFLQGVESRLDSLFAEDSQPIKEKDSDPPRSTVQDVASNVKEDIREVPDIKEANLKSDISSEPIQTPDKSSFISEIEKRFSAIFGEDDKNVGDSKASEETDDLKRIIAQAEQEEIKSSEQSLGDISSPPSSILHSPLKDMKSIILSIEWEINDHILEQLEDEINKLYLLYTGDRIIQGFLRILRFMGRYVRVRGDRSNQDSINLLLFVYDHLENVMVSEEMTEAKKHIILIDNIKKYRAWVENTDLETPGETHALEAIPDEVKSSFVEPLEDKPLEDNKAGLQALADIQVAEETPIADAIIDKTVDEEMPLRQPDEDDITAFAIKEPDVLLQTQPSPLDEIPTPVQSGEIEDTISTMKDLPPHEAFAYALEELKKTFQTELDALKEEIRILKNAQ